MAILPAYVGAIKDSQTSLSTIITWQSNAQKHAMVFTTGSAYSCPCFALAVRRYGTGALTGTLDYRIYAGDPSGAQVTLASGQLSIAEIRTATSGSFTIPIGLDSVVSLANGTVYTLELSTTAALNGTDYIGLGTSNSGGGTGNQRWLYDSGAWAAQGVSRVGFVTVDNSDGGKFIVRTDCDISSFATYKGAAVHSSDTYSVCMGATLTRATGVMCLQGKQGDSINGPTMAYSQCSDNYKYGMETVSAGLTVKWTGSASAAASGWVQNPTTADTSSKGCRINLPGTSGSRITVTNNGDAYNVNEMWAIVTSYGGITHNSGYVDFKYALGNASNGLFGTGIPWDSTTTTQTTVRLHHCTCIGGAITNNGIIQTFSAGIPVVLDNWTIYCGYNGGTLTNYLMESCSLAAGGSIQWTNLKVEQAAGATGGTFSLMTTCPNQPAYFTYDGVYLTDTRFSEATPTTFAVADRGTGGELTVTVANISAIAANDYLKVYLADGTCVLTISRARYEAAYGTKSANEAIVTGLANGTAYNGMYAMYTRDSVLFGAASNTANGTPTLSAAYADYLTLEATRNDAPAGFAGSKVLTGYAPKIKGTTYTGSATEETHTANQVLKSAGGNYNDDNLSAGNIRPVAFGLSQTGDLANLAATDAAYLALEATRNNDNGTVAANIIAPATVKIRNVTITGSGSGGGSPPATPAITVNGAGTGITVDGAAGVTNRVYYSADGRAWTLLGSRTGDGDVLFGSLEGSYYFQAVSLDGTTPSLPSNQLRRCVGLSTRSMHERVWLDCAAALEAETALAPIFIDREENRIREILDGAVPGQRLPYLACEWPGEKNSLDVEETDDTTGQLVLNLVLRETPGQRKGWEIARLASLIAQTLAADETRGDLVFTWEYRGAETTQDAILPHRVARLTFAYEFCPAPTARVTE